MPNYCDNTLEITASPEAIAALLKVAKTIEEPGSDEIVEFSFLPFVEENLTDEDDDWRRDSFCELIGCKWPPQITHMEATAESIRLWFMTPWAPSDGATRFLASWLKKHRSEFSLLHSYEEPGVGFCGLLKINQEGELEQYGDLIGLDCSEDQLDSETLNLIVGKFKVSEEHLRELAAETDEYLNVYPEFFRKYCGFEKAVCFPPRVK